MSNFKPNDRFSSLKEECNTFKSSKNKNKKNRSRSNRKNHKKQEASYDVRENKPVQNTDFQSNTIFPVLDNEPIKETNDIEPLPLPVPNYLEHCKKIKEERENDLCIGFVSFRLNKKTRETTVITDGVKYNLKEYREKMYEKYLEEQEREAEIKIQESYIRMQQRYEKELWEEYEMYGESSIMWQEHCRYLKHLEEYPEEEEEDYEKEEEEDYYSYSD